MYIKDVYSYFLYDYLEQIKYYLANKTKIMYI